MTPTACLALLMLLPGDPAHSRPAAPSEDFTVQTRVEAETATHILYEIRFPTARPSRFPANNTVWGHLYLPQTPRSDGSRPPCILVLPIMAAPNAWVEQRFVETFVRRGFAAMWLEMPYQFHRRPHPSMPSGQVFLARTARQLGDNFRQSIADARRALDWLKRSELVDGSRLGLFGISLGGMVAAAVYTADPSPKGAVLLLAGADFPSLLFASSMTGEFVRSAGIDPEELRRTWTDIDPAGRREANRGKKVLLINARWDAVVPKANALKLKEAFPDARQVWVPFGHYSAILHVPWVRSYAAREFSRLLLGPGPGRR